MTNSISVLIVEDEQDQRRLMAQILRGAGYQVFAEPDVEAALQRLEEQPASLVVSDWKLPGRDGMALLAEVRERFPQTAFIMATAYGSISHAVEAVRSGADDYLVKPFQRQVLLLAVERTLKARSLADENRRLSTVSADLLG